MIEKANPQVNSLSNLEGYVSFSYYLGVFAFVALAPYIWKMFEMLNPSTVINILAERITKQNILSSIKLEEKNPVQPIIDMERDPIQPIIDIVHGSMMKYDYETVRDGLKAIGENTGRIFENEILLKDEEEKISEHVFNHLARVGKLSISREDEDSVLEVIANLRNNGKITVAKKLDVATEWIEDYLVQIGLTAAEEKLEDTTWKVVISLGLVGENQLHKSSTEQQVRQHIILNR